MRPARTFLPFLFATFALAPVLPAQTLRIESVDFTRPSCIEWIDRACNAPDPSPSFCDGGGITTDMNGVITEAESNQDATWDYGTSSGTAIIANSRIESSDGGNLVTFTSLARCKPPSPFFSAGCGTVVTNWDNMETSTGMRATVRVEPEFPGQTGTVDVTVRIEHGFQIKVVGTWWAWSRFGRSRSRWGSSFASGYLHFSRPGAVDTISADLAFQGEYHHRFYGCPTGCEDFADEGERENTYTVDIGDTFEIDCSIDSAALFRGPLWNAGFAPFASSAFIVILSVPVPQEAGDEPEPKPEKL